MNPRSTFSLDVADYMRKGYPLSEALRIVLGGITDGSGPRISLVLADLKDMGYVFGQDQTENSPQHHYHNPIEEKRNRPHTW